jgi:hypothetical protein
MSHVDGKEEEKVKENVYGRHNGTFKIIISNSIL